MATIGSKVDSTLAKMEDQLKLWGAKLNEAMAGAQVTGQEAKIDARKKLDELKAKVAEAQAKLDEAKAGGDDKWENFKGGVESSWKELEDAFKSLGR